MTGAPVLPAQLRFTPDYEEKASLEDRTAIVLRLIRPDDASRLQKGFQELSTVSRYLRFFGVKSSLSTTEAAYLTEVDGVNHFAICAVSQGTAGEEIVGVARFLRLTAEPASAEMAIVVADRLQGKGLGRILLERLIAAARERQITRFRFEVLASNARMRNLLHDVVPDARSAADGSEIHFDVSLNTDTRDNQEPSDRHPVLHRFLALVAGSLFKD
jgi:GNAT superfamily N-acetyltransferase